MRAAPPLKKEEEEEEEEEKKEEEKEKKTKKKKKKKNGSHVSGSVGGSHRKLWLHHQFAAVLQAQFDDGIFRIDAATSVSQSLTNKWLKASGNIWQRQSDYERA